VLPELLVLINLTANSTDVELAENLYTAREPSAEYFFYAASDTNSLFEYEGKSLIDMNAVGVNFEVNVTYEAAIKDIVLSDIDFFKSNTGDDWNMIEPIVESKTADEVMQLFKAPDGFRIPAEVGEDYLSYVEFFSFPAISKKGFFFHYRKIVDSQVLTITGYCADPEITVGDVHQHWVGLVDQYKDVPLQQFTGANKM